MDTSQATRILLLVLGAAFLPYGLFCFVSPSFLGEAAGVTTASPTGMTEVRAMYGGLQAAFGAFLFATARDARLTPGGLAAAAFVMSGLALGRGLGLALDGGLSGYTGGALAFEAGSAAIALTLLGRQRA